MKHGCAKLFCVAADVRRLCLFRNDRVRIQVGLVPKPSVQPTLSRAFVAHFVEPCGFWPFSTKWSDKLHNKGPHTPFLGQALFTGYKTTVKRPGSGCPPQSDTSRNLRRCGIEHSGGTISLP